MLKLDASLAGLFKENSAHLGAVAQHSSKYRTTWVSNCEVFNFGHRGKKSWTIFNDFLEVYETYSRTETQRIKYIKWQIYGKKWLINEWFVTCEDKCK